MLGIEPMSGGAHPLMGTHNRVFRIDSSAFERAYFEIIAVDPAAPAPERTRWFDLDDSRMRRLLARGPRLIHFVARADDADAAVASLAAQGVARGSPIAAERGALRWKITVRPDGQRLFDGALPTLIEWQGAHPCDSLPPSGVALQSLTVNHPQAERLRSAYDAIGLTQVPVEPGEPQLTATLSSPKGMVRIESKGTD
jgi:hypothetical protein